MQLKTRIEILLFTVMILFVALASLVQRYIVYNSFVRLERAKAEEDIERCVEAVNRECHHLATQQRDWSRWDATFAFMEDHNPDYITTNLSDNTFVSARLNLIYLVDTTGRVVWGKVRDTTAGEDIHLKSFPDDRWPTDSPLLAREDAQETVAEVMLTERGPMLVAAGPILDNNAQGPFRGTLVMGRFFDAQAVETLVHQTRVDFMVWPVQEEALPDAERQLLDRIPNDAALILDDVATDKLRVYHTYPDMQGKTVLLLCALVPRSISAHGREAVAVALVSVVIMGLIAYLAFRAFLQRTVTHPIVTLTRHAAQIGESNELSLRIPFHRSDEIGTLAKAFNGMLERLEQHSQERERLSKELERLSQQDALTGLANRRAFDAALEMEWRRALRSEEFVSVIMIDVDCFKAYNDNYGHPSGDSVLRQVAAALSATLRRPGDLAARYGGEEFVLILPATDHGGARHVADAIREAVAALTIPHSVSPVDPSLTVSLGVATAAPYREGSAKTLIDHADQALYRAKQSGRNRVEQAAVV